MTLKRKKIIAREFLLLICIIVISILAYIGTFPYNYVKNDKIKSFENSITSLTNETYSIEKQINSKVSNQKMFYNEYLKLNPNCSYNNYTQLWRRLSYLQKSDSIIIKWNNLWSKELKEFIKKVGFQKAQSFDNFVFKNSLNHEERKNLKVIDSIGNEVNNLKNKINIKNKEKLNSDEQLSFTLHILAILGIITFPLRYLIYSIIWSVVTLKKKE